MGRPINIIGRPINIMGCPRIILHVDKSPMGWLRLVGSSKLQVSFAEYHLFYRALLQKRRIILRSLLIVATPYLEGYTVGWLR